MANQLEEKIILTADGKNAVKSIKDLRDNVKKYKDDLTFLNKGSEEYNKTLDKLAESQGKLNKINRDARNVTANLTDVYAGLSRSVEGVTSGFQIATSAMTLFGVESDNLVATIAKLQSIQGVVQGLYGLSNGIKNAANILPRLNKVFKAFNATLLSSPLFWIAAVIVGVIAGLKALDTFISNSKSGVAELNAKYEESKKAIDETNRSREREIDILKAQGATTIEIIDIRREAIKEDIKNTLQEIRNREAEIKALEEKNKRWFSGERKRLKALKEINDDQSEYYESLISQLEDIDHQHTVETVKEETNRQNQLEQARKTAQQAAESEYRERQAEIARLEQLERDRIARFEAIEAERRQNFIDTIIDFQDEVNSFFADSEEPDIPFIDKIIDFSKPEAVEARIAELNNEAQQLREIFTEQGLGTAEGVDAWNKYLETVDKVKGIEKEYTKTQKDESERRVKLRNAELSSISSFLTSAASLFGENTAAGKATAVAGATINTYLAGSQALAAYPPPASFVALAATIATGLANVKNILSTNVPGASDSSAASVAMPTLPTLPEVDTSAFEVYSTINPDDLHVLNDSRPVLVVEDVNQVQERVSVAETSASF